MRIIYLELSKPKAWWKIASPVIRWFQGTPYSHCSIKTHSDDFDGWFQSEASVNGVDLRSSSKFRESNHILASIPIKVRPRVHREILHDMLMKNERVKYDFKGLIGNIWVKVNHWFGRRVRNPLGDGIETMRCDEWCAWLFNKHTDMKINDQESSDIKQMVEKVSKFARHNLRK